MPDENQIIEPLREQAARNEEAGFPHPVVHLASAEAAVREAFAAGRAAATPGPRCGNCGHVSFLAAATPDDYELVRGPYMSLVAELVDPDPCQYDHNDLCQAHSLDPRPCPHERARAALAAADREKPEG